MRWFWKIPLLGPLVFSVWKLDARRKYEWLSPYINSSSSLLEIGSGPGSTVDVIQKAGHKITPLDISDTSYHADLRPVIYDGEHMPFPDNHFDTALLLTTLHHTPDPENILREARRVAHRVIIIEDIYNTPFQRKMTKIADSITNLEFWGHPHSNRNDKGWRTLFEHLEFNVHHASQKPMAGYFLQSLYVLDKKESMDYHDGMKKVA